MPSFNEITILGHIGKDPQIFEGNNGSNTASYSIACSRKWKDKEDNWKTETEWFNVKSWGYNAQNAAKYLKKGALVLVSGDIRTDKYQKDGVEKHFTYVNATRQMDMTPREKNEGWSKEANSHNSPEAKAATAQQIPF